MSSPASARQRFSHSRLAMLADCPRRYRFRYVEKAREAFRTVEAFLGTLVHEALGWLYAEREEARTRGAAELSEHFRALWQEKLAPDVRVIKSGRSLDDYRHEGEVMLEGHHRAVFLEDRLETMALEPRVSVAIAGQTYLGFIDRLAREPVTGKLRIIDFKTGRRVPDSMEEAELQVRGYGLAVLEEHGGQEVDLEYQFLRQNRSLTGTLSRPESHAVAQELAERIADALEAERADDFPARPGPLCSWCGFRESCDASGFAEPVGESARECPRCGAGLRLRQGRHGAFFGCSGFPACRFSRDARPAELA